MLQLNKVKKLNQDAEGDENEHCISDGDLDNIVGVGDSSDLQVFSFAKTVCILIFDIRKSFGTFATGNGNST